MTAKKTAVNNGPGPEAAQGVEQATVSPLARVQARRGVLMQQAGQAQQELRAIQERMAADQQRLQELIGTMNAINGGLAELEQVEKMLGGG